MKKCFLIISICIQVCGQSQSIGTDTLEDTYTSIRSKPYEVAFKCASVNTKNEMMFSNAGEPLLEILNGVLFRYKFNRLSLRVNASFFEKESSKDPLGFVNYQYGSSTLKSFKIGAGLQWTPFMKKEFIYVFMDCNYKSRNENSTVVDVLAGPSIIGIGSTNFQTIHSKANGLDMVGGLGTKLRIYKSFYFSMEAGYNQFAAKDKTQTIQILTNQSSTQTAPYHFDTFLLRLYLSLIF